MVPLSSLTYLSIANLVLIQSLLDLAAHGDYKNDRYGAHDKFGKHGHGKYGHNAGSYGNHGQNYKR